MTQCFLVFLFIAFIFDSHWKADLLYMKLKRRDWWKIDRYDIDEAKDINENSQDE